MSRLLLAFAIGPGISIAVGGIVTKYLGWVNCFYALAVYGLFLFVLACFLPETQKERDLHAMKIGNIVRTYYRKLRNGQLITAALLMGCVTATNYLFVTEAPFIGVQQLGLSPETYGLLNCIPPLGLILGLFLNHILVNRISIYKNLLVTIQVSPFAAQAGGPDE